MGSLPDIGLALLLVLNLVFAIRLERRLRLLRSLQADMVGVAPLAEGQLREALAAIGAQVAMVAEAQASLDAATTAAQALRRDLRRMDLERLDDSPPRELPQARGIAAYAAQAVRPDPRRDSWPVAQDEGTDAPLHRAASLATSVVALPIRSKAEQALEAALRRRR